METFDFGFGPVHAHRHANGGGWVAETASVSESAYVGPAARVCDNAQVYGNAQVYDNALVYGNALVYDNALVYGNAQVKKSSDVVCVSGFTFGITVTPTLITVGCQTKSHADFLKVTKPQAIAMGLPADEYSIIKSIVKAAIKQVTK